MTLRLLGAGLPHEGLIPHGQECEISQRGGVSLQLRPMAEDDGGERDLASADAGLAPTHGGYRCRLMRQFCVLVGG
jgi:hypothetical protein